MKKILLLLVVAVTILSGCSANTTETVTIEMGLMKDIAHIPYIYAVETGMYEEAGLDVNLTFFNSAKDRNAGWETGEYQIQTADLVDGMMMTNQGQDVEVTGSILSNFKLVASPAVSEKFSGDIKSLDGMSVGYSENTVTEFYIDYIANEYGIEFDKTPVPAVPDRYAMLTSGELDLAILPDPFPEMAIVDGAKLVWQSQTDGVPQLSTLTINKTFKDENSSSFEKFIEVSNKAVDAVNEMSPSEYKDMVLKYELIDEAYYDAVTTDVVYSHLDEPTADSYEQVNAWLGTK